MPSSILAFYAVGMLVAALEEFITQGVLKNNSSAWIITTPVAFLPFLTLMWFAGSFLYRRLEPSKAMLRYHLLAGSIGLMVEWFLIGLTPWGSSDAPAILMAIFQFGMFSFWAGVACAPMLLLEKRPEFVAIRTWYRRYFILGMAIIYFLTFATPPLQRFVVVIGAVILVFAFLNIFYIAYIRKLKKTAQITV